MQEIALARQAELYCGLFCTDWQHFGHAVSLFVEIETATEKFSRKLKEAVTADGVRERYANIRKPFSNATQIGASVLIKATNSIFRHQSTNNHDKVMLKPSSLSKIPLLGLEQLITRYTQFEAGQPRDTIYAYLALANDTVARTKKFTLVDMRAPGGRKNMTPIVQAALRSIGRARTVSEGFHVDYNKPIVEVFQQFVEFAIHRANPGHALNILVCPWAPRILKKHNDAGFHEALDAIYFLKVPTIIEVAPLVTGKIPKERLRYLYRHG